MIMPGLSRMVVSPRFELFFALAAVLDPNAPEPSDEAASRWLTQARRKLDQSFRRRLGHLGVPQIWRELAQRLGVRALDGDSDAVIEALADLQPAALTGLSDDPEALRAAAVDLLRRFDRLAFAAFWRVARSSFAAAAQSAPLRGGDSAATDETVNVPSVFASDGYVVILEGAADSRIVVRFFSPTGGSPVLEHAESSASSGHPTADNPALVFHALGDATRYAIASLLARDALTSADLARRLGVAAPTLAHHLRALRLARLVLEEKRGNSILLRLNRATVAGLSAATVSALYDPAQPVPLRRSRRA
jgi:DNA-binding transcriptional ArsR family regulator